MSVVRFPRPKDRVQPFVEVIGPGEKGDPYDIIVWKNDECDDGYTFQVMEYADVLRVLSVIEETYGSKMRQIDNPHGGGPNG
jgi:hypothetical protein